MKSKFALIAAVALSLMFRLIAPEEAYRSVEWPVIVLVACMLAFGTAALHLLGSLALTLLGMKMAGAWFGPTH